MFTVDVSLWRDSGGLSDPVIKVGAAGFISFPGSHPSPAVCQCVTERWRFSLETAAGDHHKANVV